jgi:hypothetical protein
VRVGSPDREQAAEWEESGEADGPVGVEQEEQE